MRERVRGAGCDADCALFACMGWFKGSRRTRNLRPTATRRVVLGRWRPVAVASCAVTALAKCESCGAALRLQRGEQQATCAYCGVTSVLGTPEAPVGVPRLRIEPAPAISDKRIGAIVMGVLFGLGTIGFISDAVLSASLGQAVAGLVFAAGTALCIWGFFWEKRSTDELRWFRENGVPARAKVERISGATQSNEATLGLNIEVTGAPIRNVDHRTLIPPLIIPRLTEGMALPIIVHPRDPGRIEVQWHLL
jgi:hypothetical protein